MGALACALTSIKIVISNQSAHWPTIQNITHGTAAGPRWVTRLKSVFTEPGEMQTKPTELHCRFYSRSVFSHLWLLRAYWCHVSSVVPSRHYPFFHMFPSRGKKRAGVGEGGDSSCAGGWRKQAGPDLVLGGGWTRVEARLSPNTSSPIPLFSPSSSSLPSICSSAGGSFHIRCPPSPHRWGGRSTPSQLGDSDFHATSPPSPQARGYKKPKPPITPRCGIGLKEPCFAQRSDHHPRRNQQHLKWFYFLCAPFFGPVLFWFIDVGFRFRCGSISKCEDLRWERRGGGVVMADHHHRHLALRF